MTRGAGPGPDPEATIPLARLLAMAYRLLIDGLHERLAERGWTDVRPPYGFVLLAVRRGPVTGTDVAALMGMTKQAASQLVDAMEGAGYLSRVVSETDRRVRVLTLSDRGARLLADVEEVYADIEGEWARQAGDHGLRAVRDALSTVVRSANDGVLPAVRPTW